jgi:hypothetical protein
MLLEWSRPRVDDIIRTDGYGAFPVKNAQVGVRDLMRLPSFWPGLNLCFEFELNGRFLGNAGKNLKK